MMQKENSESRAKREKQGSFIAFEGIDGSGKTTQIRRLAARMRNENMSYFLTKEPTGGALGRLLRRYLSGELKTDQRAIAALFAADRIDHLTNEAGGIIRKIQNGVNVITDRYYLSSFAYQGDTTLLAWVISLNEQSMELLKPACHIFIDVDVDTALNRVQRGRRVIEIYETKEKLDRIKSNYYKVMERLGGSESIVIIDGNRSSDEIEEDIWAAVSERI